MSSLHSKQVADVLDRLFEAADKEDPPVFERIQQEFGNHRGPDGEPQVRGLLAEVFMPVDRAGGRFLYCLARAQGSRLIVEFGTSFGELLEPRLRPGAAIVGDDVNLFPEQLQPYIDHVRNPANGYVSQEIPLGDGLELSIRL